MWQFAQIGKSSIEEKPKHSIDVIVAIEDPALRDFYVNYEHTYLSEKLPTYRPIPNLNPSPQTSVRKKRTRENPKKTRKPPVVLE
jgi:hypothetical protein